MHYYNGFGMMNGWGFFDPLGMLFGWVIFVILLVVIVRALGGGRHWMHRRDHHDGHSSALDILQERFAKGEITKEQYNDMKKTLGD